MRLYNFLNESDEITIDKVLSDCDKALSEFGNHTRLWRGVNYGVASVFKVIPRKDRRPKDTPLQVQNILDDLFKKKFGWKARSEGVFVSNGNSQAGEFGKYVYRFLPIGDYKYVYNPGISDLTAYLEEDGFLSSSGGRFSIRYTGDVEEALDSIVDGYKNKDLSYVATRGMEASFHCPDGYYLIDASFIEDHYNELFRRGK